MGACVGYAFLGKRLGKKALLLGAVAQSLPDIDTAAALWMNTTSNLLAHRGITHSFFFTVLLSLAFASLFAYWYRKHHISHKQWILFFFSEISIHLILDAMNAYGVGWFEPFNHSRISFHNLYVVDPFFSIWSFIAFVVTLLLPLQYSRNKKLLTFGIGMSVLYLLYSFYNKATIEDDTKASLQQQKIHYSSFITTPTPLNNWLWYIVAASDRGYYIGYRSVFDRHNETDFHFFPRNDQLKPTVSDQKELGQLLQFSQGYYTLEKRNDTLLFNVLRFGQIVGWYDPTEKFAFHYYLEHDKNKLVMQRGRFAKWNKQTVASLLQNIKGAPPKNRPQ